MLTVPSTLEWGSGNPGGWKVSVGRRQSPVGGGRADELGEDELNDARYAAYNELIQPYRDSPDSDSDTMLAVGFKCYEVAYGDDTELLARSVEEIRTVIEEEVKERIAQTSPREARDYYSACIEKLSS